MKKACNIRLGDEVGITGFLSYGESSSHEIKAKNQRSASGLIRMTAFVI